MKNTNRVNVGAPGETPKKQLTYSQKSPATSVAWMAYADAIVEEDNTDDSYHRFGTAGDLQRPKTSRHKQHPTPDEFADYVIPSPERGCLSQSDRMILSLDNFEVQLHYIIL